jgi:N-acetylglucosamine-6-phosphate deacetylase
LAVTSTLILSGAGIVMPDRLLPSGSLVIEGARIVDISDRPRPAGSGASGAGGGSVTHLDLTGHLIVPGFIDVHVHGVEGHDGLAAASGVAEMARRLPRYGVTGFCPTTIACGPDQLAMLLSAIRNAQRDVVPGASRVLKAHLESNFINPDYRGAQPIDCIRRPPAAGGVEDLEATVEDGFTGADILAVIESFRPEVGIVTLAPEMPGGIEFTRALVAAGHRVSLGHSGATYDQAMAGVAAGARHATHLFNRMTPLGHREPGLAGAVLRAEELAAEIICDGHHVHPATARLAIDVKRPNRVMAITDGTSGSGLPVGSRVTIGDRPITVTTTAAYLDDGTLAGSTLTMDGAFRMLVNTLGFGVVEAAVMCATTPARELKLEGRGAIAPGAFADLAILDQHLKVARTYVDGTEGFSRQ